MSKQRKPQLSYSGMHGTKAQSVQSAPLVIERTPGRPDLLRVNINFVLAAPELAMYADYSNVTRARDGVQVLFGKLHPLDATKLEQAIDISFPYRPFVTQLHKSVVACLDGTQRSFSESVRLSVEQFGYSAIESLEAPKEIKQLRAFRSNFVYMALHEDDAVIDFYHLDAATMRMAQESAATAGQSSAGFRGVMRVVISPTLLLYFLGLASTVAHELMRTVPGIAESSTVEP